MSITSILITTIVLVYIICTLIIFGIDFWFYLVDRYSRFHIGRWNEHDKWIYRIKYISLKWVKRTPTVKITDNNKFIALDMINGKYRSSTIQSWQIGGIILGLLESRDNNSIRAIDELINKVINRDGTWKMKPVAVDCGLLAYAILKATDDVYRVKPAMDYAINIIENNICYDGMVSYLNDKSIDERYVDTLGFVCPFLELYASVYNDPKYSKISFDQIKIFNKYGLLENTYIPNHAYNPSNNLPLGVFGWGRGVAWYVIALIDTYLEMNDGEDKELLKVNIKEAADSYMKYQREDGGFGSVIQNLRTYDSSATAVLSYFYSKCFDIFNDEEYLYVSNRCIKKLKSVTRINGKIDWCQGDTKGIGVHSQTFDIMPFAQGFALRAALINLERE